MGHGGFERPLEKVSVALLQDPLDLCFRVKLNLELCGLPWEPGMLEKHVDL